MNDSVSIICEDIRKERQRCLSFFPAGDFEVQLPLI